jgi:PII-like signaling protein
MPDQKDAVLLRIFVGEEDRFKGHLLYQAIVQRALATGLAGATVLPGPLGFGQRRLVRSELNIEAGPRMPLVVEIIDTEEKIDAFLPAIDGMIDSGLITLERVRAVFYRSKNPRRCKYN